MPKSLKSYRTHKKDPKIDDEEEDLEDDLEIGKIKKIREKVGPAKKKQKGKDDGEGLFTVDTKGSFEGISKTRRRELARAKLFPPKPPNIGISASEEFNIARAGRGLEDAPKREEYAKANAEPEIFDLWATELPTSEAKRQRDDCKSGESMVRRVAQTSRPMPCFKPNTLHQKVSAAPAVLLAHEGQSMNPAPMAYENLACAAAAKVLEAEREEEAAHRGRAPMTATLQEHFGAEKVRAMDDEAKISAFRSIVVQEGDEGWESSAKASVIRSYKRKKQSKRNREHARKTIEHTEKQAKAQKAMIASVGEVGSILKEMKEREQFLEQRREFRNQLKLKRKADEIGEGAVPKSRRIGKTKFQEEALVIPDAEAAKKGLRSMPIGGRTAVEDRVASIMRRGLLAAPPEVKAGGVREMRQRTKWVQKTRKAADPLLRQGSRAGQDALRG